MKRYIFLVLMASLFFWSCKEEDKIAKEIDAIVVEVQVSRFDREFANAKPNDIPKLKQTYPYLFPEQYTDSVWVAKLTDTLQVEILKEVDSVFTDFDAEQQELESFFKHVKYYFPNQKTPKIITVITDVEYNNPVILTNDFLFLGLDNYLGTSHKFYGGIQSYIASGLDKKFLIADVANAFAKKVVPYPVKDRTFLAQLIYYGKQLYIKDKLIPFKTDAEKIKYSQEDLDWSFVNEEQMWRYYVERELLYSTDVKLRKRFLDPAPFSKFQLELDSESPGRLGRFLGWQMVRSYMEKNDTSLQQLLKLPAEEIFKKSNYKPKR